MHPPRVHSRYDSVYTPRTSNHTHVPRCGVFKANSNFGGPFADIVLNSKDGDAKKSKKNKQYGSAILYNYVCTII